MKILGIRVNKDNNMRNHLDHLNARVTTTYNSLREVIPFMTPENRKIIINSKLRGQVNLFLLLILNQSQQVRKKAETLLMRINKIIYGKKYFKVCNETICKEIQMPEPEIKIVKAGAKAIQKIMYNWKTPSIQRLIRRTSRSTSNFYHLTPKKNYTEPLLKF